MQFLEGLFCCFDPKAGPPRLTDRCYEAARDEMQLVNAGRESQLPGAPGRVRRDSWRVSCAIDESAIEGARLGSAHSNT